MNFKQRFKFPDEKEIFEFLAMSFLGSTPCIHYVDSKGRKQARFGFTLKDLTIV